MTNEERAIALVYDDVICRVTEEVEAQRMIKEALDAAVAEALPRWVPVTERVPESPDEMVLITYTWAGKSRVCAACYDSDDRHWNAGEWSIGEVVAWQPLPAAWVAP